MLTRDSIGHRCVRSTKPAQLVGVPVLYIAGRAEEVAL